MLRAATILLRSSVINAMSAASKGCLGTAAAHGDADISARQRGRVVDAIADHGDLESCF